MKIDCVITSVGYGDFLAYTLPHNRVLFDRTVVATTAGDRVTRRVCEFWHVACVVTGAFTSQGGFAKGAGINAGLAALGLDDWCVHMDADIMLPPLARRLIEAAELDRSCVYGVDRMLVRSFEEWTGFLGCPAVQQESGIYVHAAPFPIGTRIVRHGEGPGPKGWVPIGFFQLWHPGTSGIRTYPAEHTDAGRGDMLFAEQWARGRRQLIPELIAYHLESAPGPMGINWQGRKSPPFGPIAAAMEARPLNPQGPRVPYDD
jgi:hypothetical protein